MAKRGPKSKKKDEIGTKMHSPAVDNLDENNPPTGGSGVINKEQEIQDDPLLPNKSLFRVDEVARYFNVSERTIRLWLDHGHLVKENINGIVRVPRESILACRFGFDRKHGVAIS